MTDFISPSVSRSSKQKSYLNCYFVIFLVAIFIHDDEEGFFLEINKCLIGFRRQKQDFPYSFYGRQEMFIVHRELPCLMYGFFWLSANVLGIVFYIFSLFH